MSLSWKNHFESKISDMLATGGMLRLSLVALVLITAPVCPSSTPPGVQGGSPIDLEVILRRHRIDATHGHFRVERNTVRELNALLLFYSEERFQPVWVDSAHVLPGADSLLWALRRAYCEGLDPENYHLATLERLKKKADTDSATTEAQASLLEFELLSTDGFLSYAADLKFGRTRPPGGLETPTVSERSSTVAAILASAIESGRIAAVLSSLDPPVPQYQRLYQALAHYHRIVREGGWRPVHRVVSPARRSSDRLLDELRERLRMEDYLDGYDDTVPTSDSELVADALRRFQASHGLSPDGIPGPATIGELNVSVGERLRQIEVNMERWRWLTYPLGDRYVMVNINTCTLFCIDHDTVSLSMPVVVGRPQRPTPVMRSTLEQIVVNPRWNVPADIAAEIVQKLEEDTSYFSRAGFRVMANEGGRVVPLDSKSVSRGDLGQEHSRYRLQQQPGPANALGRLKFVFPNPFNVYIHDSPGRAIFSRSDRELSHGCIRVARPMDLAFFLIGSDASRAQEIVGDAMRRRDERSLRLPNRVPVYILYLTAWSGGPGGIQFRRDTYHLDNQRLASLDPVSGSCGQVQRMERVR